MKILKKLLDVQESEVWHPESGGVKVKVRRSRFGRIIKPRYFATKREANRK